MEINGEMCRRIYLLCALVGGVTQLFSSILFGPMDTGVLGLVAPFPDKQAVFNGEHDLRFDFRHERLRNKSLYSHDNNAKEKIIISKKLSMPQQTTYTDGTHLDFSGFSNFNRIWDNSPTKSSSTL